jgi:hypothetical protein
MNHSSDDDAILDCDLSLEFILQNRQSAEMPAPREVAGRQRLASVHYYSFAGLLHRGQIVADVDVIADIVSTFEVIRSTRFPIRSVIPFVDRSRMTPEGYSASLNNSSAYNFRSVRHGTRLSEHAYGRAVDLNPMLNPLVVGSSVTPANATYDISCPGTILGTEAFVSHLKSRGWVWGGEWHDRKDYMHFEKNHPNGA